MKSNVIMNGKRKRENMKVLVRIIDFILNNCLYTCLFVTNIFLIWYYAFVKYNESMWLTNVDVVNCFVYFLILIFIIILIIFLYVSLPCFYIKPLGKFRFCSLTKKYVLEKIELKNVEALEKMSYAELKKVIYDFETIMMIEKNEIISEEQKLSLKEKLINSKDNPRKIRKICMSEIEEMEKEYKKVENEVNKRYNEAFLEKSRKMLKETIENSK